MPTRVLVADDHLAIREGIRSLLAVIPGIGGVKCTFDHGGNWQPDNMTASAQRKLADRREFIRSRAGVYVEGE